MAIEAGKMRHRCALYQVDNTARDESGSLSPSYTLIRPFWAEILTAKQAEKRTANGKDYPNAITFHCRFMPGVTPDLAVLFKGQYYEIKAVDNTAQRDYELYLVAETKL